MSPEDNQNQQPEDLTIDSSTSSGTSQEQPKSMSKKSVIREWVEAVSIAIILAFTIRVFVVQAFKIPSGSMIPTLLIGDHILVSKVAYGIQLPADCDLYLSFPPMTCYTTKTLINFGEPERGDIIVFRYPRDEDKDFIKRVIGVPGDNIEIRKKIVYINNQPLRDQEYTQRIDPGMIDGQISERDNFGPIIVPQDSYFVMGDNRDQSLDSRFWGFVKFDKIKGKAFLSYWSWNGQGSWTDLVRWERIGKVIR